MRLDLVIDGLPVAKERAKSGSNGTHRTPGKTRNWERVAAKQIGDSVAGNPFRGRVQLTVVAVFARPLDKPTLVTAAEWSSGSRAFASSTADLDNIVKAVQDAANRAKAWADDRRVVRLDGCESVYAAVGETPCVEVSITDHLPRPRLPMRRSARPVPSLPAGEGDYV